MKCSFKNKPKETLMFYVSKKWEFGQSFDAENTATEQMR